MDVVVKSVDTEALLPGFGSWLHYLYRLCALEKVLNLSVL